MTTDQRTSPDGPGTTARDEARNLKDTAVDAAAPVAETAKQKTAEVVTEVRDQTRRLAGETVGQVNQQAGEQRDRAVAGLRSMSADLHGMSGHGESAWVVQLARHGAGWTEQAADFLDGRELSDIIEDCRAMARRRPGRFLLGALAAGVIAGRLSRAIAAESKSEQDTPSSNGAAIAGPVAGLGADRPPAEPTPTEPLGSPQPVPSAPDPGAPLRPGAPDFGAPLQPGTPDPGTPLRPGTPPPGL